MYKVIFLSVIFLSSVVGSWKLADSRLLQPSRGGAAVAEVSDCTSEEEAREGDRRQLFCAAIQTEREFAKYTADGVLDPTQAAGIDIIDQIHNLLLAKGPGAHYVRVPPGHYVVSTQLFLGAGGLSQYVLDMTGAVFTPKTPGLTPFLTDSRVRDIHLIGGRFLSSGTGVRFSSCLSGYSDFSHPLDGLEISFQECAGTVAEGIAIYNPVVNSSADNCKNVTIHGVYVHDTGRQNINLGYCRDVEVSRNRLANPALNGPTDSEGQAVNAQVFASHAKIHDNDISGTPFWIRTPASMNAPASGVYVWGQDVRISYNHIHDSKCTDALCDQHGRTSNIGVVDAGSPFPFGGTAANYAGVDGVHLDTVSEASVINNTISGYSTGVTVEVSRNVDVRKNTIEKTYRNALYDSSRYQRTQINLLNSLSGLSTGAGVSLGLSNDCGGASMCVTVSARASVPTGTILLAQKSPEPTFFDASNLFPQIGMLSTADVAAGALSLVLSSTLTCDRTTLTNSSSVVLPVGALHKGVFDVREFPFDYGRMFFLHLGVKKSTEGKFLSWCLVTTADLPARAITLSLSNFEFSLSSEFNRWEDNDVAGTGQFGVLVSGCGRETSFKNNRFTDLANGDYAYNAYGWLLTAFVGNSHCRRDGLIFAGNRASPSSEIERRIASSDASATHVSALALGGTGSHSDQPFGDVEVLDNVIVTGRGNLNPRVVDSSDARGLRGVAPKLRESGTVIRTGSIRR